MTAFLGAVTLISLIGAIIYADGVLVGRNALADTEIHAAWWLIAVLAVIAVTCTFVLQIFL
jgi:uncharacterized membrane protein HdeD (DUF308 family)